MKESNTAKLSTFTGVFTPTIVTILGVMMYLRQGWMVGNAGLIGAFLILFICLGITTSTALSISSIATNVRLHAGGAYAIISRSIGKEAGGAVGFMLYMAQTLAIVMYIFGFREGWLSIFPNHDGLWVDLLCFIGLVAIVQYSTTLAFRLQYIVFAITILSVVSVSMVPFAHTSTPINWFGTFSSFGGGYLAFWKVLAVYFPAVTGVLAGTNLSGDLEDPRRSIPKGTLWALTLSSLVYFWLCIVYARIPAKTLLENYNIMSTLSWSPALIKFAILGATFSASLANVVAAPKILHALASDKLLFASSTITTKQNSLWFTCLLVFIGIMLRDLNVIAPMITICFLTTYGVLNSVILIEQKLGLLSFRPTFRIPLWIPAIGAIGCVAIMLIINATITMLMFTIIAWMYLRLNRRPKEGREDIRTNLFLAFARWTAKQSLSTSKAEGKAWMPHPLVPLFSEQQTSLEIATVLSSPNGSMRILQGIDSQANTKAITAINSEIFIQTSTIKNEHPEEMISIALELLKDNILQPNIVILAKQDIQHLHHADTMLQNIISYQMGIIYHSVQQIPLAPNDCIHVWIRPQGPDWNLEEAFDKANIDLALLIAIKFHQEKRWKIRLITTLTEENEHEPAQRYLEGIMTLGRLPKSTTSVAFVGNFWTSLHQVSHANLHIFGWPTENFGNFTEKVEELTQGIRLFVKDSGKENLLA